MSEVAEWMIYRDELSDYEYDVFLNQLETDANLDEEEGEE